MFDGFTRDKGSLFDVVYKHIDIYQDILIVQYSDNIFFFSPTCILRKMLRDFCVISAIVNITWISVGPY